MGSNQFSIGEAFQVGWDRFRESARFWLGTAILFLMIAAAIVVIGGITGGGALFQYLFDATRWFAGLLIVNLVWSAVGLFINFAYVGWALRAVDRSGLSLADCLSNGTQFVSYFVFWVVMGSGALAAAIVLGVGGGPPGLFILVCAWMFVLVKLGFVPHLIIDKSEGLISAISDSWTVTKGVFWKLLGFYLLAGLLNLMGILPLGLGLPLTLPVTFVGAATVYRRLIGAPTVT